MGESARRLRVVTWNVHGCVGLDGRYDPGRIARHLAALRPDIAALQEVDSRHVGRSSEEPFEFLSRQVGDHGRRALTMTTSTGRYGQLLASRWPLVESTIHDVSIAGREPRKIIEAHVDAGGAPIRILATHLGLNGRERRMQLCRLRDIVHGGNRRLATVVMGDFNDWRRRGMAHRILSAVVHGSTGHATFPSRLPLLPLDRILCHPAPLMIRSWTVREGRQASDHVALAADLEIGWPATDTPCSAMTQGSQSWSSTPLM